MNIWGWQYEHSKGLNDNLFCVISSPQDPNNIVRGKIINPNWSLSNHYSNIFEGTDGDSRHSTVAGILQGGLWANEFESLKKFENRTTITKAQSLQIWTGFDGQNFSLELEFIAFQDPKKEVEGAISILERWSSPILNDSFVETAKNALDNLMKDGEPSDDVFGYTPNHLNVSLVGKRYNSIYVIQGLEHGQEVMKIDKQGNRLKQTISLSLVSRQGLSQEDFNI